MEHQRCPRCSQSTVLGGEIASSDGAHYGHSFVSQGSRPGGGWRSLWPGVTFTEGVHACVSCGLVWTKIDPDALREVVQNHGDELTKQLIDDLDHGPNHGLPDTLLAREAAEKVSEVDALVRSRKLGAVRKYRELKGVTWDQAIQETRSWHDLTRDQKLALFGWESKPIQPVDDLDSPYF